MRALLSSPMSRLEPATSATTMVVSFLCKVASIGSDLAVPDGRELTSRPLVWAALPGL